MTKDWYPTRLLIAVPVIGAAVAFPAIATAGRPNLVSRSRQTLRALGYRELRISCQRNARCRWEGVRGARACTGRTAAREVTVRRAIRRRVRVENVRCAQPPAPRGPFLFGFNTYTTPTTVVEQRAVGATVTRLFVPWLQVEPARGVWDWSQIDQQYQEIVSGGMRPLLVAYAPPCWAEVNCNLAFAEPPSTSYDGDWSSYVRALTTRYPQAVGVEVWNEPNLANAFYPQADPQRYTQLLQEAYTAVKSVSPTMPVISGGIAMNDGSGVEGPGYASRTFLADIYADGARRWMDGLAIHVYPTDTLSNGALVWDPAALARWLQQVTDVGTAAGVRDVPIWITEMGVSTSTEPGFPAAATPSQQSSDLMAMIQAARADPNVHMALIDTLQDADLNIVEDLVSDLTGPLVNYDVFYNQVIEGLGVFHSDWSPKPAACEISRTFGGSLSC